MSLLVKKWTWRDIVNLVLKPPEDPVNPRVAHLEAKNERLEATVREQTEALDEYEAERRECLAALQGLVPGISLKDLVFGAAHRVKTLEQSRYADGPDALNKHLDKPKTTLPEAIEEAICELEDARTAYAAVRGADKIILQSKLKDALADVERLGKRIEELESTRTPSADAALIEALQARIEELEQAMWPPLT